VGRKEGMGSEGELVEWKGVGQREGKVVLGAWVSFSQGNAGYSAST
jgi:hypothetical protein